MCQLAFMKLQLTSPNQKDQKEESLHLLSSSGDGYNFQLEC